MARTITEFDTAHCGIIHDAQLDNYGQLLATASADGHVRLWDVAKPKEPGFITDLGSHSGPVYQVAWAPLGAGVLLASAGSDGTVIVWGQRATPGEWTMVHREVLDRHGAVRAVEWAPAEHGAALACASEDGTVTVIAHNGALRSGESSVRHHWQSSSYSAHKGQASGVSWAGAPLSDGAPSLAGARLATAGDDGVHVWEWSEMGNTWDAMPMDTPAEGSKAAVRDVAWKPWDGACEMLASADGSDVTIWHLIANEGSTTAQWQVARRIAVGQEVWKLSWLDTGNVLFLSCGEEEQRAMLLKQRLDGEWDLMDVQAHEA